MALEASVQTDHGCAVSYRRQTRSEKQKTRTRRINRSQIPWEENYDEMANA
jgi:hypothetical protein